MRIVADHAQKKHILSNAHTRGSGTATRFTWLSRTAFEVLASPGSKLPVTRWIVRQAVLKELGMMDPINTIIYLPTVEVVFCSRIPPWLRKPGTVRQPHRILTPRLTPGGEMGKIGDLSDQTAKAQG